MYTSGSTNSPKGVMISHGNLLVSIHTVFIQLCKVDPGNDIFVAYLPLAHIFELCCELACLLYGIRIGYSSPQTITDTSTAIREGQKGDLRILKPTLMIAVPIVLERLKKTLNDKVSSAGVFTKVLFEMAFEQKLTAFRNKCKTSILDRILFKRISSAVLGGRVRFIISGGGLLSSDVQEFASVCLCPVRVAYGLTETCCAASLQFPDNATPEQCGSIIKCCEIRLVNWPEAGYFNTDKPNPRGEIWIGGENVTMGYYNMPEQTKQDFHYINGIRYFATGDIGEMLPNGNLKIIGKL
jgi:long-chain acyl-CoA synthetase